MSTPYVKGAGNWLSNQDENDETLNKNYRRSIRYYKRLYQAWPEWSQADPAIKAIYKRAAQLRRMGLKVHVDHIVPICSDLVCGLHVRHNLQILREKENLQKSNFYWPDMPFENGQMFGELQPHQLTLV